MIQRRLGTLLLLVAGAALTLFGGTMVIEFGSPDTPAARAHHAVLTFRSVGCHDPATVDYQATAEGTVNGNRRSVPLTVTPLGEPGMFSVAREWPSEGRWVVVVNASQLGGQWSAVVDPEKRQSAVNFRRPATADDAGRLLNTAPQTAAKVEH